MSLNFTIHCCEKIVVFLGLHLESSDRLRIVFWRDDEKSSDCSYSEHLYCYTQLLDELINLVGLDKQVDVTLDNCQISDRDIWKIRQDLLKSYSNSNDSRLRIRTT